MILTINYFGLLAEVANCTEEQFEFTGTTVSELKEALYKKYTPLKNKDFQVAQNNKIINNKTIITQNIIALLPPFAGG